MDHSNSKNELKFILENLRSPEALENHPWAKSSVVQSEVANDPALQQKSPGQQLVLTLVKLFRQLMPSTMPKRGKRLDTNWGQFGILAAQYFAPIVYGTVSPSSLRDAGGRIDQAVSYFVFNKPDYELSDKELERYQIVGDEAEQLPISTLSDWQTQGIKKLAEAFSSYEQYLANEKGLSAANHKSSASMDSSDFQGNSKSHQPGIKKPQNPFLKWSQKNKGWILGGLVVAVLLVLGIKADHLYQTAQPVLEDLRQLKSLSQTQGDTGALLDTFTQAKELITKSKTDLTAFHAEASPFLGVGRAFYWVPKVGGDLAQAGLLFDLAGGLLSAADETIQGASPIIESLQGGKAEISLTTITAQLVEAQPNLANARISLNTALSAYNNLDIQKLSPNIRDMLIKNENLLQLFENGLNVGNALPRLLGATAEGPQTYEILLQNEDELRATGGFLTGVATIVVENGKIISYKVEDSYTIDNPDQYYPPAPWQLERYMAASHWVLRDSNWSPDFPTAAKWAEMFIVTGKNYSADGFVSIDQEALKYILAALGPMNVENVSYAITSENVIDYMRSVKSAVPASEQLLHRKDFMSVVAQVLLQKLETGKDVPWLSLFSNLKKALDERHILLQVDDANVSLLLARLNWDGAVRSNAGDFLLVVDSNIGFNKVNAVIDESLSYEIDLSKINEPTAMLNVTLHNNAVGHPECGVRSNSNNFNFENSYTNEINRCYVDYLRIYKPAGVDLLESTPHSVPAEMMPWNETIPAKVDDLIDENLPGIRGYGTLFYVPGGQSLETKFTFQIPASVLETNGNLVTYILHIQKQSGTIALPVTITIHFPAGAELTESSSEGILAGSVWTLNTDLRQDIELSVTFKKP